MHRRSFLKDSAMGVGALATGLGLGNAKESQAANSSAAGYNPPPGAIGRPVRIVSLGFRASRPLQSVAELVDKEGSAGADIIILPETCRGLNEKSGEALDGPTVSAMARLARTHQTYIVCPIDRRAGSHRFITAVLLDRSGNVVFMYDKIYPVYQNECSLTPPVTPGQKASVYQADFGRVGFAICFDVNWADLWEQMSNQGAELVIWPSAYSGGRSLQARATEFNYYIVTATKDIDCHVFDLDGEQLLHDHNNQNNETNISRITLDLDRTIFHQDLNVPEKLGKLLKEHGDEIAQDKWLDMEGWFVLKATRPGVSCRELARQYGLEELRHYINRSQCEIDKCRGWEFS